MILLDDDFMKEELDFIPVSEDNCKVYKDYYYKICSYIGKENCYKLLPSEIEKQLSKSVGFCCFGIKKPDKEKIYMFKRAMGLQLIYDMNVGRNTMAKSSNGEEDICRETKDILTSLGLLKHYGVIKR